MFFLKRVNRVMCCNKVCFIRSESKSLMNLRQNIAKWVREFREGRTSVHDEDRSGRPAVVTEDFDQRVLVVHNVWTICLDKSTMNFRGNDSFLSEKTDHTFTFLTSHFE